MGELDGLPVSEAVRRVIGALWPASSGPAPPREEGAFGLWQHHSPASHHFAPGNTGRLLASIAGYRTPGDQARLLLEGQRRAGTSNHGVPAFATGGRVHNWHGFHVIADPLVPRDVVAALDESGLPIAQPPEEARPVPEPYVGFRAWDLQEDGFLYPLHQRTHEPWKPGLAEAECSHPHGPDNPAPHREHGCGFWTRRHPPGRVDVEEAFGASGFRVHGACTLHGRVRIAERGFRSQKAKIVALIVPPRGQLPEAARFVVDRCVRTYGCAIVHTSEDLKRVASEFGQVEPELPPAPPQPYVVQAEVELALEPDGIKADVDPTTGRPDWRPAMMKVTRELTPPGWQAVDTAVERETATEVPIIGSPERVGYKPGRMRMFVRVGLRAMAEGEEARDQLLDALQRHARDQGVDVSNVRADPTR